MKFAVAALIATAAANEKDAIGCEGADWDNWTEMRRESDCIFHKLHPDAAGWVKSGPTEKFVSNNCLMKGWANTRAECDAMADKAVTGLMHAYGHNGEIDEAGFWKAYVTVKAQTQGHNVPHPIPALDAEVATTTNFDKPAAMLGCPWANWGDFDQMGKQATCFFNHLDPVDGKLGEKQL